MNDNLETLQQIYQCSEEKLTTEELKSKLCLGTDSVGMTAWDFAADKGNLQTLQQIYQCAEDKLTTEELKSKLLLGTDSMGRTAWHFAAENGNLETYHKFTRVLKRN